MKRTTLKSSRMLVIRTLMVLGFVATVIMFASPMPNAIAKVFSSDPATDAAQGESGEEQRMREGTKVEKLAGHFKLTGDRVTFFSIDDKQRFGGLKNLALERIARTVKDSPTQLRWVITGTITEYRGSNYLLVTHAVLTDEKKGFGSR